MFFVDQKFRYFYQQLDQPTFGVGRTELVTYKNDTKSKKVVDAYKKYLIETAQLLGKKGNSLNDEDVEDIIGFEITLATVSKLLISD